MRLIEEPEEPPVQNHRRVVHTVRREDGRPWIDAEGWERMGRYYQYGGDELAEVMHAGGRLNVSVTSA